MQSGVGQQYRELERGGPPPPPPPEDDYSGGGFASTRAGLFFGAGGSGQGRQLKEFFDGEYAGELVGDKKHGKGTMRYKNGTIYEGSWVNDLRHGFGVFRWPAGATYEGQFVGGQMGGESCGVYITAEGKRCDATWVSAPANTASRIGGYWVEEKFYLSLQAKMDWGLTSLKQISDSDWIEANWKRAIGYLIFCFCFKVLLHWEHYEIDVTGYSTHLRRWQKGLVAPHGAAGWIKCEVI
jgi:hypothetical protein